MMTDEDYSIRKAKGMTIRTFLPVLGLILMIAFAAIAYFLGPILTNALAGVITIQNSDYEMWDWVSRGIVFFSLALLFALVYAVAAPKPKKQVSERDLDKERKAKIQAQVDAKAHQKKVRAKMAEERKKNDPYTRG